jgi:hypothetical protein
MQPCKTELLVEQGSFLILPCSLLIVRFIVKSWLSILQKNVMNVTTLCSLSYFIFDQSS